MKSTTLQHTPGTKIRLQNILGSRFCFKGDVKKTPIFEQDHTVRMAVGRTTSAGAVNLVENQVKQDQRMIEAI